jgi:hypothetical protein
MKGPSLYAARRRWWSDCLFNLFPVVLYLFVILWVCLFPAVSITTGELKPRGLYVDEHSLLVQSGLFKQLDNFDSMLGNINPKNVDSSCDYFGSRGMLCSVFRSTTKAPLVLQIELRSKKAYIGLETTVLVFKYNLLRNETFSSAALLVHALNQQLQGVKWMRKRVVVLMVPSLPKQTNEHHSAVLEDWLNNLLTPSVAHLQHLGAFLPPPSFSFLKTPFLQLLRLANEEYSYCSLPPTRFNPETGYTNLGLLRESYTIDFTDPSLLLPPPHDKAASWLGQGDSIDNDNGDGNNKDKDRNSSIEPLAAAGLRWSHATLQSAGLNGVLPNMDMVSYPLAVFGPDMLETDSSHCASQILHRRVPNILRRARKALRSLREGGSGSSSGSAKLTNQMAGAVEYVLNLTEQLLPLQGEERGSNRDRDKGTGANPRAPQSRGSGHSRSRSRSRGRSDHSHGTPTTTATTGTGTLAARGYLTRLAGLSCSLHQQAVGGPSGLHAQFNRRNIDAISLKLRMHRSSGSQRRQSSTSSGGSGSDRDSGSVHGLYKLTETVLGLVYMSNNLHGIFNSVLNTLVFIM